MAIQGNYTASDHANFIANTELRKSLNIPDTATKEQLDIYWGNIDDLNISRSNATNLSGFEWITQVDGDFNVSPMLQLNQFR